jgi:hypothetical protein
VFPRKAFPIVRSATQRKYILNLICDGWKVVREECLQFLQQKSEWPREALALLQFFENFLPLSIDIYTIYLNLDFDSYMTALFRVFLMFLQLGKKNYVKLVVIYMAVLDHWRVHHPDILEIYKAIHALFSEEEIELFHSAIRRYAEWKKTPEQLAEAINFYAATRGEAAGWRTATGMKHYDGGLSVEHCPTAVADMAAAVKDLFIAIINGPPAYQSPGNAEQWISPVLGPISDRIFPIPLQRSRTLPGFKTIDATCTKVCLYTPITPTSHHLCGHFRTGSDVCRACLQFTTHITQTIAFNLQE